VRDYSLANSWRYPHADPSVHLFDEAVTRWQLDLPLNAKVIELGCAETDFSKWLTAARPDITLVGIDPNLVEGYHGQFIQEAMPAVWQEPESVDAVIALGSMEHFGLGFYGDPVMANADVATVERVQGWLKPGGWFYLDVPWTPGSYYITENRHFRVYDDEALFERLTADLVETNRAYAHGTRDVWQEDRPEAPMIPFWYVIRRLEKAH
jgi:hypothetical protein